MELIEVLEILERETVVDLAHSVPAEQRDNRGGSDGDLYTLGHGIRVPSLSLRDWAANRGEVECIERGRRNLKAKALRLATGLPCVKMDDPKMTLISDTWTFGCLDAAQPSG